MANSDILQVQRSIFLYQKTQHELKVQKKLNEISKKLKQILKKTQGFEPKTTCNGGSMPQYASTLYRKKKPVLPIPLW